jgi:glycosyltransferase involved in cell wall biosynthesis
MAFGLPICSSKRGPMPEILRDGGLYFDPENPESIAASIRTIVDSLELRKVLSQRSKAYSEEFSWKRTSELTFSFLVETFMNRKPQ